MTNFVGNSFKSVASGMSTASLAIDVAAIFPPLAITGDGVSAAVQLAATFVDVAGDLANFEFKNACRTCVTGLAMSAFRLIPYGQVGDLGMMAVTGATKGLAGMETASGMIGRKTTDVVFGKDKPQIQQGQATGVENGRAAKPEKEPGMFGKVMGVGLTVAGVVTAVVMAKKGVQSKQVVDTTKNIAAKVARGTGRVADAAVNGAQRIASHGGATGQRVSRGLEAMRNGVVAGGQAVGQVGAPVIAGVQQAAAKAKAMVARP